MWLSPVLAKITEGMALEERISRAQQVRDGTYFPSLLDPRSRPSVPWWPWYRYGTTA